MKGSKIYRMFRHGILITLLCTSVFLLYVLFITRNTTDMTLRQKILKAVYPITMWLTGKASKNSNAADKLVTPPSSIYELTATLNNGELFKMDQVRGKRFMIVNTASDCGYTGQYDGLEKLYRQYKDKLVILAFPANDFKAQEKGTDEDIASFCKLNYGISFPLMKKSVVVKQPGQNEVFAWLTHKDLNGWNDAAPAWNFSKYIIDEEGRLVQFFGPSVEPTSPEVVHLITK
jgi:glutathione peroxidase